LRNLVSKLHYIVLGQTEIYRYDACIQLQVKLHDLLFGILILLQPVFLKGLVLESLTALSNECHVLFVKLFSTLPMECLHLQRDSELHCSPYLLSGRVYNVTHYMDFHPGGDAELMRGVGQDGTSLFNQVGSTTVTTGNACNNFT